uniref:SHSP domain-containing protein n=1 Tax=Panagrellus redivivus TaxID=6233 RepID=A0A7E4VBW6_PANRE
MHFYIILLILCFGIYNVQCNVDLKKGRSERVSFDGDELTIAVDNSLGASDDLKICFGSTPEASFPPCPTGFVRKTIEIPASSNRQFSLTRHGQLLKDGLPVEMLGKVEFNEDGTLNITVAELPDVKTAVSLPNAKIYVPEKPEEEQKVKKESNGATIGIIVGVVALLVFVIACISAIGVCLYRRKKNKNQPIMPPEIVVQSLPKAADAPDPVPEINSKEKPPSPQAAPELVSKSPKMPVQSRPTANVVPALETKPITPAVQNPTPQGEVSLPQAPSMSTEPVLKPPKKQNLRNRRKTPSWLSR